MSALPSDAELSRQLIQSLEQSAFIFSAPAPRRTPVPDALVARMKLEGTREAEVRLIAPAELATELAANLLGVEPDEPDAREQREAALAEFLNILTGQLAAQWWGAKAEYRLGLPWVAPLQSEPDEGVMREIFIVASERHPVVLQLRVR